MYSKDERGSILLLLFVTPSKGGELEIKMENRIKVLQVFGSLNMGGAESRMMDVYRRLDFEKIQFDFISLTKEEQYFEKEISFYGGRIFKLQSPRKVGIFKHILQMRDIMHKGRYDAIHAHTSYHCGIVMLVAWFEHIPVRIAHARTTGSKQYGKVTKLFQFFGRILVNFFSTTRLAISCEAGKFLFGNKGFEILPNAIDMEKYHCVNECQIKKIKNELEINENDFVIGQVGRFDEMKNHHFTIQWFSQYINIDPKAKLILVGDGKLRTEAEHDVVDLGIQNRVIFTGVRADVNVLMNAFDVVFFPSKFEGLGGVALEAQAVGVPCVESDTIPLETDMGLDLVLRCSLKSNFEIWNSAVNQSKKIIRPSKNDIRKAFNKRGYSLTSEIEQLIEIYGSK